MKKLIATTTVLMTSILAACGGGSSSDSESTAAFPTDVAVFSPTSVTDADATVAANTAFTATQLLAQLRDWVISPAFAASHKVASATWVADLINDVLNGTVLPSAVFKPEKLLGREADARCFGPALDYKGHPDAAGTPDSPDGQLPTGDLGLWMEHDPDTGFACAAEELNKRMDAAGWRTNMALMGLAAMLGEMSRAGISVPAAGGSVDVTSTMNAIGLADVTFSEAVISRDTAGNTWSYVMRLTFTDASGNPHEIVIKLDHTAGASSSVYDGLLTYAVQDTFNGGNCPSSGAPTDPKDVTLVGTLKYSSSGTGMVDLVHRSGQYCGHGDYATLAGFQTDGQLDPAVTWDGSRGWADSFSRFGASLDTSTMAGDFYYAWQAGYLDSHSRVLAVHLDGAPTANSETGNGDAWYGYGDAVTQETVSIQGFFCNWAGPGTGGPGKGTLQPYAQWQQLEFDSASGMWVQPTGQADILYAPTDSCTYTVANDGAGFWYDRDLDTTQNETLSDIEVATADLMGKGSYATIEDRIVASGFSKPSY